MMQAAASSISGIQQRQRYEMTYRSGHSSRVTSELVQCPTEQRRAHQDDFQLRRLGKLPSLQRSFDLISLVGLSSIVLVTWETVIFNFDELMSNGGPAGFLPAYLFSWIGSLCNVVVIAELASMAPISAGQYHWCAMLAPAKWMKFLSYITAFTTTIAWQMLNCEIYNALAGFIQDLIAFSLGSIYESTTWKKYVIGLGIQALAYVPNILGGRLLPRLEVLACVVHILGFFAILIPLSYMPEHETLQNVFKPFFNIGHFSTPIFSWFSGAVYYNGLFMGGDCAVHLAEEAENAAKILAPAMIISIVIDGCLGLGIAIALLFNKQAIENIAGDGIYSPITLFYQTTGSTSATIIISSVWIISFMGGALSTIAPASRQIWSLARDQGIPGWHIWKQVSSNKLPINSTSLIVIFSLLINLIQLGSLSVWSYLMNSTTPFWCISYTIIGSLLLYRRCQGHICRHGSIDDSRINAPGAKLVWGPFRVPGIWGILVNSSSIFYSVTIFIFSGWPDGEDQLSGVAWIFSSSMVCTLMVICITFYYFVRARHYYKGPIMDTVESDPAS